MPYQFDELTDIKLIILKTVQYFKTAMPENILTDTILAHNYANFFDLQQAVFELVENRLLTYYEEKGVRHMSLTSLGDTALEGFQSRIPRSVMEKLYQTVRIKIREYENGLSLVADYEKKGDMDYSVRLGLIEGGYEIFTVSLSIFDEKMARNICREFKRNPQTLYNEILAVLLNENSEG
ncbi:MAG: DUF4364 family protein [Oscillospiraceae bacterium]|nr:DUF4364 family protein [Oscillospiraceae bacterium]